MMHQTMYIVDIQVKKIKLYCATSELSDMKKKNIYKDILFYCTEINIYNAIIVVIEIWKKPV